MKHTINIIKIGSDSLSEKSLKKIISDARMWQEQSGEKFIFISSGAVKLWRERVASLWKQVENFSKSSLSAIGQNFLMQLYDAITGKDIAVAQILIDDFAQEKYLSETLLNLLDNDIWTIVNHNDSLHPNELNNISDKTDNDKNTLYISKILSQYSCREINIKRVIYLTNTQGLLNESKNTVVWWWVSEEDEKEKYRAFVENWKTSLSWTGGMLSKLNCAIDVLDYWVKSSIIAHAENWLDFILKDDLSQVSEFYL